MKALEFIFQETQIHFLLQNEGDVMVNATEMAKAFNKRTDHYLQNDSTKELIQKLKVPDISGTLENKINDNQPPNGGRIIENRGRNGIYFCEILALDFATWLDIDFKIWVYRKIRVMVFGNYKKHWEAHAKQEEAKTVMDNLKKELLDIGGEIAKKYFEAERECKSAKNEKITAIRNQLKLFPEINK